jgi:ubiquinone/menaquinone biosynthesis C-methylase UbiE/glycosyltransferase involved in cell wall biosynthesis
MKPETYLLTLATFDKVGEFCDSRLACFSERHAFQLPEQTLRDVQDPCAELEATGCKGIIFQMSRGTPGRHQLQAAGRVLKSGKKAWFYWPEEAAIECLDRERLSSYWRLWIATKAFQALPRKNSSALPAPPQILAHENQKGECEYIIGNAKAIPFPTLEFQPSSEKLLDGTGVYLRTDFWAPITSGGSYGHTCYVAGALSRVTRKLVCFMPHRYSLLDELGVQQVVIDPPSRECNEIDLVRANTHYYQQLKVALTALRPLYMYERLCLGNYVGARFSLELGIPYLVEYNGSEISMSRSFGGNGFVYEQFFLKAEQAAFTQATLISVVSDAVRDDLVRRGVDPSKILVNPNGVDVQAYRPATLEERHKLRAELGFGDSHTVLGFTGTFGGWHGIDILADAIPRICAAFPNARFLLIGDGNYRHLVDEKIRKHHLSAKVISTGRVPQVEGARLLRACDIYLSPHNKHMVDSRFFGSPTKIFEYMALGGGIVASDLEQIGLVLSPALRASNLNPSGADVTDERAVLCTPGNLEEFVAGAGFLISHPDVRLRLGHNAREAAGLHFSWDRNVADLWRSLRKEATSFQASGSPSIGGLSIAKAVGAAEGADDPYKQQAQKQWDNDPCGSHYARKASPRTLEWFLEVEQYRYGKYAPWMPEIMEFSKHSGQSVLEIGGGMGTDLAQFAKAGALVTDVDLSAGHLELAQENFRLRNLQGTFLQHDAESLPFDDASFDLVYSNGVIHHTPNTGRVVREMHRVLKPGGRAIVMVYAENSLLYWLQLVYVLGVRSRLLEKYSIGEIMSRHVELSQTDARPLVKVYTKARIRRVFKDFKNIRVIKRQMITEELPARLRWLPVGIAGRIMGWNLIVRAQKGYQRERSWPAEPLVRRV